MNNTFNIQRFLKLLNKQTKDNYSSYLMSVAVLIGLLAITMGIKALISRGEFSHATQVGFYATFAIIGGAIFTSMVFTDLGDKKKAIPALTLPVSHLEKFLVGWIYSFVIFLLVFTLSFCLVNLIVVNVGNSYLSVKNEFVLPDFKEDHLDMLFVGFSFLHAVTLLGAIFFEKLHLIKSTFALFIFFLLIWLMDQPVAHLIFTEGSLRAVPFVGVAVAEGNNYQMIANEGNNLLYFTLIAVTILLWTAAFFKLKEKQV